MNAIKLLKKINDDGFSELLQAYVISLGDAELAYRFAHECIHDANLEKLEAIILASENARLAYEFALLKNQRGESVENLQELVINNLDAGLIILFAADVDGADTEKIEEVIRLHCDKRYLNIFEAEMRLHQKNLY
jgi:hypothetical protein